MTEIITKDAAQALLDKATPGKRVQFHGSYCKEAEGTPFTEWDSSHDMSVIRPDGSRYRLAHYKHAMDAYVSQVAPDALRSVIALHEQLDQVTAERDKLQGELIGVLNREADTLARWEGKLDAALDELARDEGEE